MWGSSLSVMARKVTKSLFEDCLCLRCGLAGGCGGLVADPASCCLRFNDCAGGLDLRDVLVFQIKAPLILVYQ
ncbi:hypothetical protein F2Q68_00008579 [Brassica cretica]|uniref:Uncharacterized protein n=1 Tax=Brassica cretica TaxID=69181 RepID=A0A8S9KTL0_BRACR|nr:hypothetical protein F2Q68_00008579 [Brassica cretica]